MQKVIDKQIKDTNLDWMDEPIKADKWRNLIFTKKGNAYPGINIWSSEEMAVEALNRAISAIGSLNSAGGVVNCIVCHGPFEARCGQKCILATDYSHAIQLPVKS